MANATPTNNGTEYCGHREMGCGSSGTARSGGWETHRALETGKGTYMRYGFI
jgi:hypothetical protein